jgi:YidC/Oxa1 family membrane protein insertase
MVVASFLSPLEHALRHLLFWIHDTIGLPWAWSIIASTVIVRTILVPLTVRQIHSMQNLQRHAPEMKAIQQRYKNDKQRQQEELMKFYRENKINPAASCLPMLAQLPVFIALYYVLRNFSKHPPCDLIPATRCVERGDFSWLHFIPSVAAHTTTHWGGFLLLVVYVVSQMASTLYMSTTMDKVQRSILVAMPVVFVFVIARFPAGLVLYWVTTNLWTVGQGLITRRLVPKTAAPLSFRDLRGGPSPPRDDRGKGGDGARRKPPAPKPSPPAQAKPQVRRVKRKKRARR